MGRTKKTSKTGPDAKAKPILEALQKLAREFANQEDGRKRLQSQTGLTRGGLDGLLYLGKGSAQTWINVILCIFDLSPELASKSIEELESVMRRKSEVDPQDKRWFAISKNWDRDTKHYWLSILEYAQKLKS